MQYSELLLEQFPSLVIYLVKHYNTSIHVLPNNMYNHEIYIHLWKLWKITSLQAPNFPLVSYLHQS